MRKILILCMSMLASGIYAENLDSFSDVQDALTSGKDLHVVVDFAKCEGTDKMQLKLIVHPDSYKIYPSVINFYIGGLALNNPSYVNVPVYEQTQYVIKQNDTLEVWGSILSADQTKVLSKVNKAIVCKLGKAANIYD